MTAPNPQISSKNLAKKCKFQAYKLLQKCRSWCRKMRENSKSVCIQSNIWSSTEKTHKQKRQNAKKNYYKKEKYSCFLLSCFANLQWCCGCNRTKSNIGHYFFYNKRIKRNHKSGIASRYRRSKQKWPSCGLLNDVTIYYIKYS